jgi:hypothetical protein
VPEFVKRLSAMSFPEIAYRLRERGRTEIERAGLYRQPKLCRGERFKSLLAARAHAFYRGADISTGEFVGNNFPDWINTAILEADRLCRHEVELLNLGSVKLGGAIDWHRDPYSGRIWERTFWMNYRPEHDPEGRDSKVIHELNRHQHLPRLAKAWLLTGSERYADEAVEQMLTWIEQNPTGIGINWQSSLEIAIRTISWLWTLFFLLKSEALTESAAQIIGTSLFAQLAHIHRHTSLYSSPNTHLIGEATALFIAGLVFADDKWIEAGAAILARESEKQFWPDGVYAENSSYYHCYALDFYLQACILARQNGFPLAETIPAKIQAMLNVVMHLTRPDGTVPLLGDDDGGRALALKQQTYRSFRDALCVGSVLFRREDFKKQCGSFAQEAFWYFGAGALDAFRSLAASAPSDCHLYCPSAGYLVQRTGWDSSDSYLGFDFGGLGMLTGGHSHADALSVNLFGGGKELLVDPGTYVYNGAPEWRRYFRSTAAHNTVVVDGRDQAVMSGTFSWGTKVDCSGSRSTGLPVDYVEGEHRGYGSLGITHRRAVVQVPGEYWILLDELRGAGSHTFDFHFHFGPEVKFDSFEYSSESASAWCAGAGLLFATFASAPMGAELTSGWMSRGYGHRQPIQSLCATVRHAAPVWAATFLATGARRPVLRRLQVERGEAIACAVTMDGVEDVVVLPCGRSEVSVAGFRMAGEFFWIRMAERKIRSAVAIRSRRFQCGSTNLLEDALCAPSAAL